MTSDSFLGLTRIKMKTITYKTIFLALITCAFTACSTVDEAPQADTHEGHEHEEEPNEDEVHLLQKQMEVMDIEMGKFQFLNLSTTVKSNGQLELPPQNKASVSSITDGRVKSILVLEGDFVKQGQVLANVEHLDIIEVQEAYMTTQSKLQYAEKDYERAKSLYADSVQALKSLQLKESEFTSLQAKLNGLEARLQLLGLEMEKVSSGDFVSSVAIRSPIRGYVRSIDITMGMSVLPNQTLFEIVDNDHIHIDLNVYEKDMNMIRKGQKVVFSLTNDADSVFEGEVFALGRAFEDEPKAMVVHAEIDNPDGNLLPGMYVDARIVTNDAKVRALPNDAIVSDGGLSYIFVLKPKSSADQGHKDEFVLRKIEVNTGAKDIGFTEVVPAYNLPEHAQMVTKGAFYLLAEMKKGEGGHGHHH